MGGVVTAVKKTPTLQKRNFSAIHPIAIIITLIPIPIQTQSMPMLKTNTMSALLLIALGLEKQLSHQNHMLLQTFSKDIYNNSKIRKVGRPNLISIINLLFSLINMLLWSIITQLPLFTITEETFIVVMISPTMRNLLDLSIMLSTTLSITTDKPQQGCVVVENQEIY